MIHSKYNISHSIIRFLVILLAILGLQKQTLQAQSGCALVDTVCTTGTTDYIINDDGMSTYTWSTNNGATLTVLAGDTSAIVDWSTSSVSNGLDSVCISSDGVCLTCRVSYIEDCTSTEICNNGIDDDGDGLIDCNDPDCSMETDCLSCDHDGTELAAAPLNSSVSAQEIQAANDSLWYQVTPESGYDFGIAINATGIDQQITIPANVTQVKIIAWGAGGGGGTGLATTQSGFGGGGGYAEGVLAVTAGDVLGIIVGEGGGVSTTANFTPQVSYYGGGAAAGEHTATITSQDVFSQAGGGRSAIRLNGVEVLTAGGGGGSVFSATGNCAFPSYGGAGGGMNGVDGSFGGGTTAATGGTQSTGGLGHVSSDPTANGFDGIQFQGGEGGLDNGVNIGNHGGSGGGGGGGYYGGGGGRGDRGATCATEETPGAGGSSYVGGVTAGLTIAGSQNNVGNNTSPFYNAGIGIGGDDQALRKDQGRHGLIVLQWVTSSNLCVPDCNPVTAADTAAFCVYVLANPTSAIALSDCDSGGVNNLTECQNGDDPFDSIDDTNCTLSLFTQTIKRKGAPTFCEILMANPSHPLATQDCDGGGQNNLIECNAGQDPENPNDDCVEQAIDKTFVPYIATGSLTLTFGGGQCLDNLNINGNAPTSWTNEINTGGSGGNADILTYTTGTNTGDMICDNTNSDNGWIAVWAASDTVNLQDPGVSCFEATLNDDLDGHFNMGWQEVDQVGTYNGGCRVTHEGNTLLNWFRTNSVMSGFPGFGVEPWIQTGWTLADAPPVPMVFKICLDSNTNDFVWYVNNTEIDRKPYPKITCP